jgi:hypothetical protein
MKNNIFSAVTVALLTLVLTGCNNGSSSSGADQSVSAGFDSMLGWAKKLSHIGSAKATVTEPSFALISDALLDPEFLCGRKLDGKNGRVAGAYSGPQQYWAVMQNVEKSLATGDFGLKPCPVVPYMAPISAITAPYYGWEVNPMSGGRGGASVTNYMEFQEAAANYTNAVFAQIASGLKDEVLKDPDAAKETIQKRFLAIPPENLERLWDESVKKAIQPQHRTLDMATGRGVGWTTNGSSFNGDTGGMTWTKSGVVWLGQGKIDGKEYTVGLESVMSASTEKSESGHDSSRGSSGTKASSMSK